MKLNNNELQSFDELPHGWTVSTLGATLPLTYGKALKKVSRDETGKVPVYGSSGQIGVHSDALTKKPALIVGRKGSVGEVYRSPVPCWPIDTVYFVEERDDSDLKYFEQLLKALKLSKLDKSTAVPGLSRDDYNAVEVAVAPLHQQKRIVEEIEKQFSRLDEAITNLKRVKANLKRYKAAVLKAAVEGRLVETEASIARREGRSLPTPRPGVYYVYAIRCQDDSIYIGHTDNLARRWEEHLAGHAADWTKQHKPIQIVHYEEYTSRQEAADREKWLKTGYGRKWMKREIEAGRARQVGYETGEQLLHRILETRRQQWLARAEQAGGKGKGKYKEPAAPDTTELSELPEGWIWAAYVQLGEITTGFTPSTSDKENFGGDIPFFKPTDLDAGENVIEAREYLSQKGAKKGRLISAGSILVTCIGATIGKTGVARVECATNQQINSVTFAPDFIHSIYIYYWTTSPSGQKQILDNASATTLPIINKSKFEILRVPLPPLAEQNRISIEVERRLSIINEVEEQLDKTCMRAERLRASTLSKMFTGAYNQDI